MRREDTKDEAAFRAEVRAWLEANAKPRVAGPPQALDHSPEAEAHHWEAAKVWQRKKYEGGWAAITWLSLIHISEPTDQRGYRMPSSA